MKQAVIGGIHLYWTSIYELQEPIIVLVDNSAFPSITLFEPDTCDIITLEKKA